MIPRFLCLVRNKHCIPAREPHPLCERRWRRYHHLDPFRESRLPCHHGNELSVAPANSIIECQGDHPGAMQQDGNPKPTVLPTKECRKQKSPHIPERLSQSPELNATQMLWAHLKVTVTILEFKQFYE